MKAFLRKILNIKPEVITVGVEVYSLSNREPKNGDVCMVYTHGYWRELTWHKVQGSKEYYYGWYNNYDAKSKLHDLYFYAPEPKATISD